MAVTLGNTGITFPDATTQTTAAVVPTNVSAFTNDAGYITSSALSSYATKAQAGGSVVGNCNCADFSYAGAVTLYSVSGANLGTATVTTPYNCNCACNC